MNSRNLTSENAIASCYDFAEQVCLWGVPTVRHWSHILQNFITLCPSLLFMVTSTHEWKTQIDWNRFAEWTFVCSGKEGIHFCILPFDGRKLLLVIQNELFFISVVWCQLRIFSTRSQKSLHVVKIKFLTNKHNNVYFVWDWWEKI